MAANVLGCDCVNSWQLYKQFKTDSKSTNLKSVRPPQANKYDPVYINYLLLNT